ncbi:MAG: DUF5686 and carboxypeptidase regulatory-like domain-containing protein [Bacteroidales bacterium]|nr:DUF5686 and carboxypeptidase regulatory-like domain-containing protein [Bacteroidales bacterium]
MKRISLIILYIFIAIFIQAQQITKIMGKVTDAQTNEPLPFVNIVIKGTKAGCITDINGNYKLETKEIGDSIIASFVGYKRKAQKIYPGRFQTINFQLEPSSIELQEVTIVTKKRKRNKDTLALELLDKIWEHKQKNDIDKLDFYEYETYNKVQFDLNNLSDKFFENKILKQFEFVKRYIDTSTVNGKAYLPVFILESVSDFYYRKKPKTEREFIKATHASGINNESVNQFMGNMYIRINLYNDYLDLFGKGFISPIARLGRLYYRYYLIDSGWVDNHWCYHLAFVPKIKQDNVFNGDLWVNDTTFAIKKIQLRIDKNVNLNFINNVIIEQEFVPVENTAWMLSKETIVADFNLFENPNNTTGFFGRKTTTYRNHKINFPRDDSFYNTKTNIVVLENAHTKDETFWDSIRHEPLTQKERGVFNMVDSIKNVKTFRTFYDIMNAIITYYYVWGKFEFGPYFTIYSFNNVEGNRIRIGGRTSNEISTRYMVESYIAYGTKDQRWKYGGNFLYLFDNNPRRGFTFDFKHDMEQLGQSLNAFREDNILSSTFRRGPQYTLSLVNQIKTEYEHEWYQGFSNTLRIKWREYFPYHGQTFYLYENHQQVYYPSFITTEVSLNTRIAYNEKFVMGKFERISLGTEYPVINFTATLGIKGLLGGQFTYQKLELNIDHWFNTYPVGYGTYVIDAGKIFGRLPYPLLKLHEGNQTYFFDEYAFNLMNYYEFVSDQWASLTYTHYFDGFLLNKIPLFRRLKWRELAWWKGLIGFLNADNLSVMTFPSTLYTLDRDQDISRLKPYVEAGIGVENILKFIRVDVIKRFSYLNHPNISKFGVRVSMYFKF